MAEELKPDRAGPPAPQKGDRWLRFVYWTVGVLAGLTILGALWVRHVDAEHQRILREARAAVETLRVPEVPDADNAARDYERAYSLFSIPARDFGMKFTSRLHEFELDIGSDEVAKLLADNAACLEVLAQAADKPHCIFTTDYSAGAYTIPPSLMKARAAALLLEVAAKRAAHDGKHGKAAEHIRQALCLARGINQPRTIIAHMIAVACEDITLTALRDVLAQTEPDAAALVRLADILKEHAGKRPLLGESLHGERLIGMLSAAEIAAGAKPASDKPWDNLKFRARRASGRVLNDARAAERVWDRVEATLAKPAYEAFQELTAQSKDPAYQRQVQAIGAPYGWILPSFLSGARSDTELLGRLRSARLAVACRLQKLRTGALPADLKELAGYFPKDFAEASSDPFTGKPLSYKRNPDGFIIWSVGAWPQETTAALSKDPYSSYPIFPVDPKLWEDHRAKQLQQLQNRPKPGSGPKTPVPPPAPPAR